jgi:hypothetical protein
VGRAEARGDDGDHKDFLAADGAGKRSENLGGGDHHRLGRRQEGAGNCQKNEEFGTHFPSLCYFLGFGATS